MCIRTVQDAEGATPNGTRPRDAEHERGAAAAVMQRGIVSASAASVRYFHEREDKTKNKWWECKGTQNVSGPYAPPTNKQQK